MKTCVSVVVSILVVALSSPASAEEAGQGLDVGIGTRDITPDSPIWLSGYAARKQPSERVDHALEATALAIRDPSGERVVIVAIDNCELGPSFAAALQKRIDEALGLAEGTVIIVPSHTHSAPVLEDVLQVMFRFGGTEKERVAAYSEKLRAAVVEAARAALADLRPARLELGMGSASFAMNRRVYREEGVAFGENPEGPADHDVPVLRITGADGTPRAVVFGYACHGTSIAGEDFYVVSGDYMAYAREHIEKAFPGTKAIYLTGFGADINPSPRGRLSHAKQHGLELAGAIAGVLNRPMEPIAGRLRRAYARLDLPLAPAPTRERLLADAASADPYVQARARLWLARADAGEALPSAVSLPMGVVRIGEDLTFFVLGGEVVVDYALRLKREFAAEGPWMVGYAFEVPCYIPSMRILKEGGYEADSSLIYYGIYGPILGRAEDLILGKLREMIRGLRG
jgi:hypothetical protein